MLEQLLGISTLIGVGGLVTYAYSSYKQLKKEQSQQQSQQQAILDNSNSNSNEPHHPILDTMPLSKCKLSREEREFIRKVLKDEYYNIRFDEFGGVSAYKVAGDPDKLHLYPCHLGHWEKVSVYASEYNHLVNVIM